MTEPRDFGPQDELTTGERRAFAALPRELAPPADLEERAVALLRRAGQLPTPITLASRRGSQTKHWWIVGAVAASLALFASGLAVGQYVGMRQSLTFVTNVRNASEANDRLARSGNNYVAALASFASLRDTTDMPGRERAKETAVRVLGAAAQEIANLAPDDPLAAAVLRGLNERARTKAPEAPSRSVIWY